MRWKVCGLTTENNILDVSALMPNFIGFIFYEKSKRYVDPTYLKNILPSINKKIKKVGVFVNEEMNSLLDIQRELQLDYVQLHGDENVAYVETVKKAGLGVVKVFRVGEEFDMKSVVAYDDLVDYFLFDTHGPNYGGHGVTFEWSVLKSYKGNTPFFISGGIGLSEADQIASLKFHQLHAIDVNSQFEIRDGIKNVTLLSTLKNNMQK